MLPPQPALCIERGDPGRAGRELVPIGWLSAAAATAGLHASDATQVGANVRGEGVHEAARIAAKAGGGEILGDDRGERRLALTRRAPRPMPATPSPARTPSSYTHASGPALGVGTTIGG